MAKKKAAKVPKAKNWDSLWSEYSSLLKKWAQTFQPLQKASSEVQSKYNEVMLKAANESSEKTIKEFHQNWQKSMSDAALEAFKQFDKNWQNITDQGGMERSEEHTSELQSP